jgi:uncharacterized protein with HEPN domain
MQPEDRDPGLLGDMLAFALEVDDFCAGVSLDNYLESIDVRRKTERSLELVGEAAKRVSSTFQAAHPEVPWRRITGLRNVLAHAYGEINDATVWNVAKNEIPGLVAVLRTLVGPEPPA